jgi:hypothetical protein
LVGFRDSFISVESHHLNAFGVKIQGVQAKGAKYAAAHFHRFSPGAEGKESRPNFKQ